MLWDLVITTEYVTSFDTLVARINNRKNETISIFANELKNASASTKLALSLVLLFGFKDTAVLNHWFETTLSSDNSTGLVYNSDSFNMSLRNELNYRIELYGKNRFGYRLTHPTYEEALVEIILKDSDLKLYAKAIRYSFQRIL